MARFKTATTRVIRQPKRIGIVAVPPVRPMDVVGPLEVFTEANRLAKGRTPYEIHFISATSDRTIPSEFHIALVADMTYMEKHPAYDTLLIAGGEGARSDRHEKDFVGWLRGQCEVSRRYGSVCTGALVLAKAGLLDEHHATTHWKWCEALASNYPSIQVDPDPIFIKSGRCYTSAGVTAGIDLSLALVEEDLGREIALRIAQMMVVFLRRPGGQSQFSVTLSSQARETTAMGEVLSWIAESLHMPLSVVSMARRAAMSPRNFTRVFVREIGKTPRQHLEDLRLETARRLLETTSCNLESIAERCGFSSPEILRRTFSRRLKISPSIYRRNFGQSSPSE